MPDAVLTSTKGTSSSSRSNRPEVRNAIDSDMSLGVLDALARARRRRRTAGRRAHRRRRIVLCRHGPQGLRPVGPARRGSTTCSATAAASRSSPPSRASRSAAGSRLALIADLLVASARRHLRLARGPLRALPGGGALLRLPRHLPQSVVAEMALTGEPIGAEAAFDHGLVVRLCEPGTTSRRRSSWQRPSRATRRSASTRPSGCSARAPGRTEDELWAEQRALVDDRLPLRGRPGGGAGVRRAAPAASGPGARRRGRSEPRGGRVIAWVRVRTGSCSGRPATSGSGHCGR